MDLSSELALSLEKEKKRMYKRLMDRKKSMIKKCPLKYIQIREQSFKHEEESRGHG